MQSANEKYKRNSAQNYTYPLLRVLPTRQGGDARGCGCCKRRGLMRSNLHASAVSCRLRSPKMKWICRQASEHKIVLVDCAITFRCRMLQTFCYSVQTVPVACCRVSAPFTPSAQKTGQIVVIEDDQVVGGGMGRNAESHSRWGDTAKSGGRAGQPSTTDPHG